MLLSKHAVLHPASITETGWLSTTQLVDWQAPTTSIDLQAGCRQLTLGRWHDACKYVQQVSLA